MTRASHYRPIRRLTEMDIDEVATGIGYVTMAWAQMEAKLDLACLLAFQNGGRAEVADELPRALKRKTDFLKRCTWALPWLAHYRTRLRPTLTKINTLADSRHDLIHGTLLLHWDDRRAAKFHRHAYLPDGFEVAVSEYNKERVEELAEATLGLFRELCWFLKDVDWPLMVYRFNNLER